MVVFVIGMNGLGLMPTTPRKARILVSKGKAKVVRKTPYTIRLLYKTGCATQPVSMGIDTGSQHIGVAAVSGDKVLFKEEFQLRSTMEKRKLLETRREFRRGRRYRKTRYRKPKFKYRTRREYVPNPIRRNGKMTHWRKKPQCFGTDRPAGWLPPSIQSKADHHIRIIKKHMEALPPGASLRIEVGRFDVARMKDPNVYGELYQRGRLYDHENVRAYVFERDGYKCKVCGKRAGTTRLDGSIVKLVAHHIDFRSRGATDNPDRMASVCDRCHTGAAHEPGGVLHDWMLKGRKFKRGYRDATHMNILRARLRKEFKDAAFTYGNFTKVDREAMGLKKTHANDAVAIAAKDGKVSNGNNVETVYYKQVRGHKRSLHEANPRKGRKEPNRGANRNAKNTRSTRIGRHGKDEKIFHLHDKVVVCKGPLCGCIGWISGFTGSAAYVKDKDGQYIQPDGLSYKQINLSDLRIISHNNNWLIGSMPHDKKP